MTKFAIGAPGAALIIAAISATTLPAMAAPAMQLGQYGSWNAAAAGTGAERQCYILATPTSAAPDTLRHGDVYFFVKSADAPQRTESSLQAGYEFASGSEVTVTIGNETFRMITQGNNAWLRRIEREPELLAAMRAGSEMVLEARSGRGNETSYTFSLSGVTAASRVIERCG
jgi:invasion protein IalB